MKVLIKIIIWIFFLFSIVSISFASNRWQLETILDLNYWIETLDINSTKIDNIRFNSYQTYRIYKAFKDTSIILKNELIRQYRNWDIWYYQMNWLVTNYKSFIYYSNRYFYFLKQKEVYPNNKSIDYAIIKNLTNVRSYYMKIKFLVR